MTKTSSMQKIYFMKVIRISLISQVLRHTINDQTNIMKKVHVRIECVNKK